MANGTKKGLSPLAWVGIGCGLIMLVGVVAVIGGAGFVFFKAKEVVQELEENPAKTVAEMVVRTNPDLELLNTDDEAGTITFRDTTKGEEVTLNFEDLAEGNFSFTTSEGEYNISADSTGTEGGGITFTGPDGEARIGSGSMDDVPEWVPLYPGSDDLQSTFSSVSGENTSGILSGTTADTPDQVAEHYKEVLEGDGYEVNVQSYSANDQKTVIVTATKDGGTRSFNVTAANADGTTNVGIQYNGKG